MVLTRSMIKKNADYIFEEYNKGGLKKSMDKFYKSNKRNTSYIIYPTIFVSMFVLYIKLFYS